MKVSERTGATLDYWVIQALGEPTSEVLHERFRRIPITTSQVVFDAIADQEGQVIDGFLVHMVDRKAGTLRIGATEVKAVKLISMERGTMDVVRIIRGPKAFALHNETRKPRGAQWKREKNQHRRSP